MKLAHMMAARQVSADADDNLEPSPPAVARVADDADDADNADDAYDAEPDALILDEFDPALSFRDAKERAIARWERWYVARLLDHTRGNLSEAARIAHSDRGHLRKLARKHLHWDRRSGASISGRSE